MQRVDTTKSILERLLAARLVTSAQIDACRAAVRSAPDTDSVRGTDQVGDAKRAGLCESGSDGDSDEAITERLCEQGTITRWQLRQVESGHSTFFVDGGRYLLLDEIGRGGMGAVFRARHTRLNRDVALKVIDPKRIGEQPVIDRFQREVEVCSRLQHEHVVQALDVGRQGGTTFLVMEYVEGSPLSALVKRDGPMSPDEAAGICLQAASGLAYAHAQGIIHRDVKPSNILLSTAGTTKILDMGLARIVEEAGDVSATGLTQDGTVMGTVDFMAPEQAQDARRADARCDIYSLGATLYFLLTGRVPLPGRSAIEKLHRLATEEPQPLGQLRPDCPRELVEVVERMMAKNPADRFQTAEEVVRALGPLAADRIAGRPVATASVQSAAETHREPGAEVTVEYQPPSFPFEPDSRTALSSIRRRDSSSRWIWLSTAAAVSVVAAIAGVFALLNENAKDRQQNGQPNDGNRPDVAIGPAKPPADVRVEFPGHYGGIWSAAFSPDGSLLATGGGDGFIYIWNPTTGRRAQTLVGHHSAVIALDWSPDGKRLVSGDYYGSVRIWRALSGKELTSTGPTPRDSAPRDRAKPIQSVVFHPRGSEIAYAYFGRPSAVVRWSLADKKPAWSVNAQAIHVAYSTTGEALAVSTTDGEAVVWDTQTGERRFRTEHDDDLGGAAFLGNERLAVIRSGAVQLWNWQTGAKVGESPLPRGTETVRFGANGWALSAIGRLSVFRLPLDELVERPISMSPVEGIWRISPNVGRIAYALAKDGALPPLSVVRSEDGGHVLQIEGNVVPISAGAFFNDWLPQVPSERHVLVMIDPHIWYDVAIGCFDVTTARPIGGTPSKGHKLATEGDARYVLRKLTEPNGGSLATRIAARLQETDGFPMKGLYAEGMNFTEAALYGLRWTRSGEVVWATDRDRKRLRFWKVADGRVIRTISIDHGEPHWNASIFPSGPQVSADGNVVAVAFHDGKTRVWHAAIDPDVMLDARVYNYGKMVISPDGRRIAALPSANRVELWDAQTGEKIGQCDVDSTGNVDLRFSDSGRYLLTSRQLWDMRTAGPEKLWECPELDHAIGKTGGARGGDIFPDERHVVVAQDAQYQIWNWRENRKRATIFVLPGREWAFVNHESGYYRDSGLAFQYLRFLHRDANGGEEWLGPLEYEKRSGWQNDPAKAGLDLSTESANSDSPPQ